MVTRSDSGASATTVPSMVAFIYRSLLAGRSHAHGTRGSTPGVAGLRPGMGMRPGDEHHVRLRGRLVGLAHRRGHDLVIGGELADRVGPRRVAGELERLAAAAAEVELAAVAAPAGIGHPVRAPEGLEDRGLVPDPGQVM